MCLTFPRRKKEVQERSRKISKSTVNIEELFVKTTPFSRLKSIKRRGGESPKDVPVKRRIPEASGQRLRLCGHWPRQRDCRGAERARASP